jgi:hypothetical protein
MTTKFPARVRAWLVNAFYCETPGEAADAMADATRWGWLPALSGVAAGAEQVRVMHPESVPKPPGLSA